MQHAGRGEKTK